LLLTADSDCSSRDEETTFQEQESFEDESNNNNTEEDIVENSENEEMLITTTSSFSNTMTMAYGDLVTEEQLQEEQHELNIEEDIAVITAPPSEITMEEEVQQQQQQSGAPIMQQQQHLQHLSVWEELVHRFDMEEYEGVSMKCRVYNARLKDKSETQEECIIKVSYLHQFMRIEADNYHALENDSLFMKVYEYHEPRREDDVSAIIMEKGGTDIYRFLEKYGAFTGSGLQDVAKQVADVLYHMHVEKQMIWCELKSGNFILTGGDKLKAIDVESAVKDRSANLLYTSIYAPPEFAIEDLCGRNMEMEYSFDIWSYGMLLYELAAGGPYHVKEHEFDRNDRVRIFSHLKNVEEMDLDGLHPSTPPKYRDLIRSCLAVCPSERITIQEIMKHPYFDDYEPVPDNDGA